MREINLHHANKENPETDIRVFAMSEPDSANDVHRYKIEGFYTSGHPNEYEGSGSTQAVIMFQSGNPAAGWNGLTLEALLAVCADRLDHIQEGPHNCPENEAALTCIFRAIRFLHNREARLKLEAGALAEQRAKEGGAEAQAAAAELVEKGLDTSNRVYEAPKLFAPDGSVIERPTGPLSEEDRDAALEIHQKVADQAVEELMSPENQAVTQALIESGSVIDAEAKEVQSDNAVVDALDQERVTEQPTEPIRMIPAVTEKSKHCFLLDPEVIAPIAWEMGADQQVITAPLLVNVEHDFVALSNPANLLEAGIVSPTDHISPEGLRLEGFYIQIEREIAGQIVTELLAFGVRDENTTPNSIPVVEGGAVHCMSFVSDMLHLNRDTFNTRSEPSLILRDVLGDDLEAKFTVGLSGSINLATGNVIVSPTALQTEGEVVYANTDAVAVLSEEKRRDINQLLSSAKVVAFDLIAYRESYPASSQT